MLNRSLINKTFPIIKFDVEKQRVKFFSKVTGQTDPVYFDEKAALEKGYPSLLTPPTFLTTVGHEQKNPYSNIKIKYIGLQKGEKISEKLYLNKIQKSKLNKDILIANEPNYNLLKTNKLINKLEILLNDYKSSNILKEMKLFLKQELN